MAGLASQGFTLSSLSQAPTFPAGLGRVLAIDPEAIAQAAVNGQQRANTLIDNFSQERGQHATIASLIAQKNLERATAEGEQQRVLPVSLMAQVEANRLAATKAATETPVVEATNTGALGSALNANQLLEMGTKALPGFPAKLAAIAAEPDPAKQYAAYAQIQADNPWLNHPSFAGENSLVGNERNQALAILQARASQQAKLQQIGAVVQGRQGVADTAAQSRESVAQTNAGARVGAAGGALNVATSRYNDALDNLASLMATPDMDPASIDAAERDVATKQSTLTALQGVRTAGASRSGASTNLNPVRAVLPPAPTFAPTPAGNGAVPPPVSDPGQPATVPEN